MTLPPLLLVGADYFASMWVKKCSVLYLSSQNFNFLSFCRPPLLPLLDLVPLPMLPLEFSVNLHLSAVISMQALQCPSSVETNPTGQLV